MISLQRELRDANRRLEQARDEHAKAQVEVHRLVRRAVAVGMPKAVIAKTLGISRQTVYNILAE
jgi:DNA-binding XRE family transcriptional regulator